MKLKLIHHQRPEFINIVETVKYNSEQTSQWESGRSWVVVSRYSRRNN